MAFGPRAVLLESRFQEDPGIILPGRHQIAAFVDRTWVPALSVLLPLAWMFKLGLDANWDLRNYHLYNPHAWLSGRDAIDIAPAQLQSWHNPLLDVPLYLITVSGMDARWSGAWLVLPNILCLLLLFGLQRRLSPAPPGKLSQLVLALLAVTGAAFGSTMGSSMNDSFVAAAMLGSVWIVFRDSDDFSGRHRWLLAGLLAGAITGLKLAAIFYCEGLAVAAIVQGPWLRSVRRLVALVLGGIAGFALTYGYWGWRMFRLHGNPFFPYYNNFFTSPDALSQDWADRRFRAVSLLDALSSPIQLLQRTSHFSEGPIRDPRLLIGLMAVLGLWLVYRSKRQALGRKFKVLAAFTVASWLLWVFQYGIYRYAIVLELIGCLALVLLLQGFQRGRAVALVVVLLMVGLATNRPDWGRLPVTKPYSPIVAVGLSEDSLVLIATGEPVAYVALGLPDRVPVVAVYNNLMSPNRCMGLQMRASQTIAQHTGHLWLLDPDPAGGSSSQAVVRAAFGLEKSGPCWKINSDLGLAKLCPQARPQQKGRKWGCPRT